MKNPNKNIISHLKGNVNRKNENKVDKISKKRIEKFGKVYYNKIDEREKTIILFKGGQTESNFRVNSEKI